MKRLIALVLVLVLVVALVGCGKGNKRQPIQLTLSTEDAEAILRAAGIQLPDIEVAAGANSTVKWYGWGDPFQNYDEDEIVNTGFWTFKQKYNCDIDVVDCVYGERFDTLAMHLTAGTPPDVMPGGSNSTAIFPMRALRKVVQAADPYINFDDPLWAPMKDLADLFAIGDKHYQICITTKPSNVVVYNTRVLNEFGYEDPAELYYNDEWTWDKFYDMCLDFNDPDMDRYALDGYAYVGMFMESTGEQVLMHDENGYYSNIDSPKLERAMQYLYDLKKNDAMYSQSGRGVWTLRGDGVFGSGMKDGLCLFYVIGESFFTNTVAEISAVWGDIAQNEIMFAPLPRDPQGDGVYYMASSFEDIKGSMAIIEGAQNPEGAALLASCIRFKVIDPIVIQIDERQLKDTYLWNDDMIAMSKECKKIADANFIVDLTGDLPDNLQSAMGALGGNGIVRTSNDTSWGQLKEQYKDQVEFYIEQLNADIADYITG